MESSHTSWWRRHGWTVALLLAAFGFSFAIRTIWSYPIIAQWGAQFTFGGGSDSYYHYRVMQYIILNHQNLIHDPMLRFPIGAINPREPLFDWMNAILGIVFAPFFGGNAVVAGSWFLDLQAPLWAALGVFPVYLIGREVAGRRVGLAAALIYPFLSANIDSTIFGYANYLSFYTFVILVVVYSYLRTVKAVGSRRWVENYRDPRSVLRGLRGFLATERNAVKWAVFTGVSFGALALAWQGFTYAVVVIGISTLALVIVERVRRVDSFGLYIATWIVGLVGFPMAMPYYIVQQQFHVWFDLPLLLFFGVLLLLLPFMFLRDVPWIFSIPLTAGLLGLAAALLAVVNPGYFNNVVTGQGYFVKNLIYSTIAEVQAPSIDQLIVGYGVVTFFLSFVGIGLVVYEIIRHRFPRVYVVFLVFALLSFYLPISAAKFFEVGSPIFALLPALVIIRAIDIAGFPELRRTVASLSDRRSQLSAFRKAFKVRHVVLLLVVVGLVLPNVWVAIDAGIPGNTKSQLSSQVAATLPTWLQPNTSDPSGYYFGAAGSALDTPNQYDSAGYNWLAQQNPSVPAPKRPAFVSWWDYGFQAIAQGNHPSVADNFQNGIDPAGQFLLSQNESQAIGVLTTTLLQAEQTKSGLPYLPADLNTILRQDGLNLSVVHSLMVNTTADYSLVVSHPDRYLPVNPATLTDLNAMYLAMEYYLATALPLSGVAHLYNDVQAYTGWSIGYAMSDSRLFPFSGTNTGIFYAPAELTGRVINSAGLPTSFFNVTVFGSNGQTYPAGQVPAGVTPINYTINYFPAFYNSMIYHIYVGYNGTEAGLGSGIPGLEGSPQAANSPLMPGWMLQHFQVVYRTAYYCGQPNSTASVGGSCFVAMNLPTAQALAQKTGGTANTAPTAYFSGGESILEYYPGEPLLGRVALPNGAPVGGVRVTVDDGWGIPHMTTVTAPDGSFSLVLPPGNDTINITAGSFDALRQQGSQLLKSISITVPDAVGLSFNAPSLVRTVTLAPATVQGFVYWNVNNSSSYVPSVDRIVPGATVLLWGEGNTSRLTTTTDASGSFLLTNVPPGLYNYSILYAGRNYSQSSLLVSPGAQQNATVGLRSGLFVGTVSNSAGAGEAGATVTLANASGPVASAVTDSNGHFVIQAVGAGNYTLVATGPSPGWRSEAVVASVASPGGKSITNLTVRPTTLVTVAVRANGAPASGIAVRFTPVAQYAGSSSPIGSLLNASGNATVVTTGPDGSATAALPSGPYSIYALGFVGPTLEAGVAGISVGSFESPSLSISLSPALSLSGSVARTGSVSASERTAVTAYATTGGSVTSWAEGNGSYSLLLPGGAYSVYALSGSPTGGTSSLSVALGGVTLAEPTRLALDSVSAITADLAVGAPAASATLYPAAGATVQVSAGPGGPAVPAVASSTGRAILYLPSVLPGGATYCVAAQAFGFLSASACGITPNGLESLTQFPITLAQVSVSLRVVGLPSSVTVHVNFTAQSSTAVSRTFAGGNEFAFSAPPGVYAVSGYATLSNGTLYLSSPALPTTIPVGATYSNLTLYLLPKVLVKGTVTVPAPATPVRASIVLVSPELNLSLNGSTFENGFYATPGEYSAYSTLTVQGTHYVNLTRLSVGWDGQLSSSISLVTPGVTLTGTLANTSGARVPLNTTLTFTVPGGPTTSTNVTNGSFSAVLPPSSIAYEVQATGTTLSPGPNGSYYRSWTSASGATCLVTTGSPTCNVPMAPETELVWLNGSLTSPGTLGPLPGSLDLIGPYPSQALTVVSAPNGTFAVPVLPGAYYVYASGSGAAAGRAAFASVLALPGAPGPFTLSLEPTWTATVQLVPPNGTATGLGPVQLLLRDAAGHLLVVPGLSGSSTLSLALPIGNYSLLAVANGSLNGVPSSASANARLSVVSGNVGTTLALSYVLASAVNGTLVGPTSATVAGGTSASFAFTFRNTGNIPVTVHPVGTPSTWSFNFSFSSVTLAPGQSASGEVQVQVPAGTPVAHPPVSLEFAALGGTIVGSVAPSPVVNVVGYYGVRIGASGAPAEVGPQDLRAPFYVVNSGNTAETVTLSIVDASRLSALGWRANVTDPLQHGVVSVLLNAGDNRTFYVTLNASSSIFVLPGSATVSAAVVNASGAVQAVTVVSVSAASVRPSVPPGGSAVVVTGPSIGSAPTTLPDWLVPTLSFVPAIALAVGLASYRWWRTRRWTRR